ncbi:MAG TPA: hypothetical protein VF929_10310 [Gemmatimonadaceae bacterium]
MNEHELGNSPDGLTRRELLRSVVGATTLSVPLMWPGWLSSVGERALLDAPLENASNLYTDVLKRWCDGLVALQIRDIRNSALHGSIVCPACALVHGRCGDAVYPLLHMARATGNTTYLQAALGVHDWSEQQVSRPDGSWVNDVTLSSWKGITVFHSIALAEALHHHGELLDAPTRRQWTERLARAATFLDGFLTIESGNINYPVTGAYCFAICGQLLENSHYLERARELAHAALEYFTPNGFLFGEGHPQTAVTKKKSRPVDLGYNVEESLPSLALYALTMKDEAVLERVVTSLRTHMEFMMPDGGWDNSWGSRNYKWTWWGSRTSDGGQPALALLAQHDPRFREAAWRNLEQMAACTHDGLLHGGPHYHSHGELPCVHHTFTHAKALATVLDRDGAEQPAQPRIALPRDVAYGVKTYPEIGTHLTAIGDWRATVTEYDFEYLETVQTGGSTSGGGHASGGALSMLFHQRLGPILVASMTRYQRVEISNQQEHGDYPHMTLTPRIEGVVNGQNYTSLSDVDAVLTVQATPEHIGFEARGRLLTSSHQPLPSGDARYRLGYAFTPTTVEIVATTDVHGSSGGPPSVKFILPVISTRSETVERLDARTIRVGKGKGRLVVRTDAAGGFDSLGDERTFNLVPGFECLPLAVAIAPGGEVRITLSAE